MNSLKRKSKNGQHTKEVITLVFSFIIVLACIGVAGFLIYKSMVLKQEIPEYALLIFSSIATYTIGHTLGRMRN